MIQTESYLDIADNSGAKRVQCIKVIGGSRRRYAGLGDVIVVAIQEALPGSKVTAKTDIEILGDAQGFHGAPDAEGTSIDLGGELNAQHVTISGNQDSLGNTGLVPYGGGLVVNSGNVIVNGNANGDSIITGNWGDDFTLLIKASKDSGLGVTYYTLNAQNAGAPRSIGAAGADRIKQVSVWHPNIAGDKTGKFADDYHKMYKDDFYYHTPKTELELLA